jgi:phosphatidyl-myo-inositol dimannoside synthase
VNTRRDKSAAPPKRRTPLHRHLVVTTDYRFARTADGRIWTQLSNDSSFWDHQYSSFEAITVVARVGYVAVPPPGASEVTSESVSFFAIPEIRTPVALVLRAPGVLWRMNNLLRGTPVVIAVLPGIVGFLVAMRCALSRRPYAVEVIAEPSAVFGVARVGGRMRLVYGFVVTRGLRLACRHAYGIAYVTDELLQRLYPGRTDAIQGSYSLIALAELEPEPRAPNAGSRLITVGSLEQRYKGVEDLLRALDLLVDEYPAATLTIVGDGRYRPELESLTSELGLERHVVFAGAVKHEEVLRLLADADLFVLASHTEGMPRALIEAMSEGLPCVATAVGGIPELLPASLLVPPRRPEDLARCLSQVLSDPALAATHAARNICRARPYRPAAQRAARARFHAALQAHVRSGRARQQ